MKIRTKLFLLTFLMAWAGQIVIAQTANRETVQLSLSQAQDYAFKNSVNTKNSEIDLQLAKKKIWETTAIGLPQLSAQANYTHLFKVPEMSLGAITFLTTTLPSGTVLTADDIKNHNVSLGYQAMDPIKLGVANNAVLDFTLSQIIFSGEYIVGLQASKVYYQMSDQGNEKTITDLKETVANTYSMVLMLEQNRKIVSQSLENLNKTLAEMRQMNKQGFIENTDVDQIELTATNLTNALKSLDRQVDASHDLLKFQLGMPMENDIVLTDNLEQIAGDNNLETLVNKPFDYKKNINFRIMDTQEALANLNMKREMSGYLPSLVAVYRHEEKANKPEFDFNPRDVVQVSMSIPIFSSGQRKTKVQERRLELEKVQNAKESVTNGLNLEYTNARNEMSTAYEKYLNEQKNIELTNRIYQKTLVKFKEGLSSSMDLTNAQNQYLTAQSNYFNAMYSLITAKNKLNKLINNQ